MNKTRKALVMLGLVTACGWANAQQVSPEQARIQNQIAHPQLAAHCNVVVAVYSEILDYKNGGGDPQVIFSSIRQQYPNDFNETQIKKAVNMIYFDPHFDGITTRNSNVLQQIEDACMGFKAGWKPLQ